jgi:bifunctional non-homologous end joining protein LigD
MLKRIAFIQPSAPVLRPSAPIGEGWIHELKHDGYRAQIHKDARAVTVYSRYGKDMTKRFRALVGSANRLRATSLIIDAEIVACDEEGHPDFRTIMASRNPTICAWCFDLLALDGEDLRLRPLLWRRAILRRLLKRKRGLLRFSEDFHDPIALHAAVDRMGLEGIVSKKADQPYKSGRNPGWIKTKTTRWREGNRQRWEMFQKA